ncbi:hypothetical protein KY285_023181 [Solanum tuberosum]|nr:hypothetical protein KY285_023181 [Solanum tuberosum]
MGRRERIPSQKALMAQESQAATQRGRKSTQVVAEGTSSAVQAARSNETVKLGNGGSKIGQGDIAVGESSDSPIETQTIGRKTIERGLVKEMQRVAKQIWEEIEEAQQRLDQADSASSGKKSWADQLEKENETVKVRNSVWDNFDITKVSNAGYKLEYVAPLLDGGYIQRLWGKHGIYKVAMLKNEVILVRFETVVGKDEAIQVPIWIRFPRLVIKYWSPKVLSKIRSLVGKPMMVDNNTEKKNGLNFTRLLVEVGMDTKLPELVVLKNEKGQVVEQKVMLEMLALNPYPIMGMVNMLSWNVRGLNGPNKQKEVKLFCSEEHVGLVGLLETKIKSNKIDQVAAKLFGGWSYTTNLVEHYNGRIWIILRPYYYKVNTIDMTAQHITYEELRKLNSQHFRNIVSKASDDRKALKEVQGRLQADPSNVHIQREENIVYQKYMRSSYMAEMYLQQKSKATWIKLGDDNTEYFHSIDPTQIANIFVKYYTELLGTRTGRRSRASMRIIQNGHCLIVDHQMELLRPFSEKEVKEAMFKIDSNKSPGSDGFGSGFYKAAWLIIGDDITKVIMDFFQNGRLLKKLNATIIALIPEVENLEFTIGVKDQVKNELLLRTGFTLGELPIRYLGLPLSSKRWIKLECQHFWGSVFVLPQSIAKLVDRRCRKYLWGGSDEKKKVSLVSQSKVCLPKKLGGLNIKNCSLWNLASVGKLLWHLIVNKDSLWVKWVHGVSMKAGEDVWNHKAPVDSSWYWRKIHSMKGKMQSWHTQDSYWLTKGGEYSITRSYIDLRGTHSSSHIAECIWSVVAQPKHRFILWLVVQDRLLTKERMLKMNISVEEANCCLCDAQKLETAKHLFSECPWFTEVKRNVERWTCLPIQLGEVKEVMLRIIRKKWNQFQRQVIAASWGAMIYHTWRVRNWKIFKGIHIQTTEIHTQIKREILHRIDILSSSKRASRCSIFLQRPKV